jgi:glyoxylase-like metal-dependent hydrolase (beta-lactamase superfamily II)
VTAGATGQIVEGLWRFEALHPEWTEDEGGEDGWDPQVSWWAVATDEGLLLVDPLVEDWDALDQLIDSVGGCRGIVRTCHWHQRSIGEAAERYGAEVWARLAGSESPPLDHEVADGDELFVALRVIDVERADEIALWLPKQRALLFGDAMIRTATGLLRVCPDSWTQPKGGAARLRSLLGALTTLPVEHVLVAHGPLVLGDGLSSLRSATS